jgi:hypothetical protein
MMMRFSAASLGFMASALAGLFVFGLATDVDARGRGGGGGGFRGGGISRGGPARGGSIRHERSGGGYRSYDRGRGDYGSRDRGGSGAGDWGASDGRQRRGGFESGESVERDGSFETRRGETVDYSGSVTRTEDGFEREGSWSSTSGASGGGSGSVTTGDGEVQSSDRSRHATGAGGETVQREIHSERHDDHVDREGSIRSSTGIDADSKGTIKKTDDGFVARGAVAGENGVAGGTVVRKGDHTLARGGATDGKRATWGRVHCTGSRCYGGRVTANIRTYYRDPYYYYPYYYGWYSCPYGGITTWYSRYGTPIYGCANVVVVHTTISLGSSDADYVPSTDGNWFADSGSKGGGSRAATTSRTGPKESAVSSAPVLMYEINDEVVSYATSYEPVGVYSVQHEDQFYWLPGPAKESKEASQWSASASDMKQPTANSTVITYAVGERIVYLTNERPIPGFYSESADELFVWIPGVQEPSDEERAIIREVVAAHRAGGKDALDREVRKLQQGREAPPENVAEGDGQQ